MGETTLPIRDDTKNRLEDHRSPGHDSWDDTLNALMTLVPSVDELREGCALDGCDNTPRIEDGEFEKSNGTIRFWYATPKNGSAVFGANYYCSAECAMEAAEEQNAYVPENPDKVVVGGRSEMRTEFKDATFYLDGGTMEVGLSIPGAFSGTDSHGGEYEYEGEPVYIYNEGGWRHSGVIEEIAHEETWTGLILGYDAEVTGLNHPDETRREEYKERHAKWTGSECAQCGESFRYTVEDPPDECPHCGAEEW